MSRRANHDFQPTTVSSHEVYRNPWLRLREDEVIDASGTRRTFGIVEVNDGVVVAALAVDGDVYLIREFRQAVGSYSLEVVNGGIDEGESPLVAAKRELEEEVGLRSKQWTKLGYVETGTGIVKCRMYLFLAQDLEPGSRNPEDIKKIEVRKVPLQRAVEMALRSKILHAPSVACLLKASLVLSRSA